MISKKDIEKAASLVELKEIELKDLSLIKGELQVYVDQINKGIWDVNAQIPDKGVLSVKSAAFIGLVIDEDYGNPEALSNELVQGSAETNLNDLIDGEIETTQNELNEAKAAYEKIKKEYEAEQAEIEKLCSNVPANTNNEAAKTDNQRSDFMALFMTIFMLLIMIYIVIMIIRSFSATN